MISYKLAHECGHGECPYSQALESPFCYFHKKVYDGLFNTQPGAAQRRQPLIRLIDEWGLIGGSFSLLNTARDGS